MAKTVQQSFSTLKQNLEITDLQETTVSTTQKNVRGVIEKTIDLTDPHSFLTGSYSRKTLISPLKEADIDIFFVLDSKYFHNYNNGKNGGQAGLLDFVKRALQKTYTKTPDISRNGQAVTIRFSEFVVDVIPGFERSGGGFLIPSSINQSWISTDPREHVKIISSANINHNQKLVPLIKMIKAWNRKNNNYFDSFHLEVLALQALDNVAISNFSSGIRFYFDKGRISITKQNIDPAGYGGDIGSYLNTYKKVQEAIEKFELAYNRALKAEDYSKRGYEKEAIDMWIKIFGNYFPSYG